MVASTAPLSAARDRLFGVDALRGVAALSVLLFHYTTRFEQKHGHADPLPWYADQGFLGVNLFFVISGLVIFMTLDRIRHPAEFLVSRFSRLFPAFWAAILLTQGIEWLAEPRVTALAPLDALLNAAMLHGYFGVPSVDGVYWTLQVELFFYLIMFGLWLGGLLRFPLQTIGAWLILGLLAQAAPALTGRAIPYALSELLLLSYLPYFALGMAVYVGRLRAEAQPIAAWTLGLLALCAVGLAEGPLRAVWALGFVVLLLAALRLRGSPGRWLAPWVWLGSISYPLYLLHQDIGYVSMLVLQGAGMASLASLIVTLALVIALAALVHHLLEDPAMRWLRVRLGRPRDSLATDRRRRWAIGVCGAALLLLIGHLAVPRSAPAKLADLEQDARPGRPQALLIGNPPAQAVGPTEAVAVIEVDGERVARVGYGRDAAEAGQVQLQAAPAQAALEIARVVLQVDLGERRPAWNGLRLVADLGRAVGAAQRPVAA